MNGYYRMARGWMNNPVFKPEPFTEREAWLWLIEEAAWRPRKKRVGTTLIALQRGQIAASLRFMATAWGWKKDRVRRFLKRLADDSMLISKCSKNATPGATDCTVITLCNYDAYQAGADENATPGATKTRQRRDSNATNEKEIKEINKDISLEFFFDQWWEEVPRKVGKGQARIAFKAALKKTNFETLLAGIQRYAQSRSNEDPTYTKHPATWLRGECWADETPSPSPGSGGGAAALSPKEQDLIRAKAKAEAAGKAQEKPKGETQ